MVLRLRTNRIRIIRILCKTQYLYGYNPAVDIPEALQEQRSRRRGEGWCAGNIDVFDLDHDMLRSKSIHRKSYF